MTTSRRGYERGASNPQQLCNPDSDRIFRYALHADTKGWIQTSKNDQYFAIDEQVSGQSLLRNFVMQMNLKQSFSHRLKRRAFLR